MWTNPQFPANLVIFTEEMFTGKLFLWSVQQKSEIRDSSFQLTYSLYFHPYPSTLNITRFLY